ALPIYRKGSDRFMFAIPWLKAGIFLISTISVLYLVYFALYLPQALRPARVWARQAPRCRFAVLVAARNEQAVIGHLVETLQQQDYPKELYDVIVIPNNCTDDTAGVAQRAGALIME